MTQVGRPSVAARCATLVHTVTTTSRHDISAAVSTKSVRSAVRSRMPVCCASNALSPGRQVFLQADEVASRSSSGSRVASGIERLRSLPWFGLPDQTRPTRSRSCDPSRCSQCRDALGRQAAGDSSQAGIVSSVVPNASGRLMTGQCLSKAGHCSAGEKAGIRRHPHARHQRPQRLARDQDDRAPRAATMRQIARELDRIAEAFIVLEQDGFPCDIGSWPSHFGSANRG